MRDPWWTSHSNPLTAWATGPGEARATDSPARPRGDREPRLLVPEVFSTCAD